MPGTGGAPAEVPEFSLDIVTSCTRYGPYLAAWAQSIISLEQRPTKVGIVTHGRESDNQAGQEALAMLLTAGLSAEHLHHDELLDYGTARNMAVALGSSPWVMHLDCDDMIMAHALGDMAKLAPRADVIALGYERCGDLKSGPKQLRKLYRTHQGKATLKDKTPCSGVSPYRRDFWERSPYRTDMTGGWDTALWLGFAHLNARFVGTSRPCFWYRQHGDSVFNIRRMGGWNAQRVGRKLESIRQGFKGVSILVPWQVVDNHRQQNWEWCRDRFKAVHPEWEVVEGVCSAREWNKGNAIDDALQKAKGEILVIADADVVLPGWALEAAVTLVRSGAPWVMPHRMVHRLSQNTTKQWRETPPGRDSVSPPSTGLARCAYHGFPGGGVVVVGRGEYQATGGIPRQFFGWGAEDETLAVILDTLLGKHTRLEADLIHLWHPHARKGQHKQQYKNNRAAFHAFKQHEGDPEAMWKLVGSGARPHLGGYTNPAVRTGTMAARQSRNREEIANQMASTSFRDRQLAAQHLRGKQVGESMNARRQRVIKRQEQRARNDAATNAKAEKLAAHKADLAGDENKMAGRFASKEAAALATEQSVTDDALASLVPGARGITKAQVADLVAQAKADAGGEG